jgi:hypothetical protein
MPQCPRHSSQWMYHGSAYGFAGEIERPFRHVIPTQAATVLGSNGGRGQARVEKFKLEGVISFDAAYVEVGGSFDDCHNRHTSYASSTVENLNILNVVSADLIVSRIAIYSPLITEEKGEFTFNITGSHFENLKIAGHKVDVKLATHIFHEHDTHSKIAKAHQSGKLDDWLTGSKLGKLSDRDLEEIEDTYHALGGMSRVVKSWKQKGEKRSTSMMSFSPMNHVKIEDHAGPNTELLGFGSIICVPKFGVVRLAELTACRHCVNLNMLRVDMCSTGTGTGGAGGTTGGGTMPGGGG